MKSNAIKADTNAKGLFFPQPAQNSTFHETELKSGNAAASQMTQLCSLLLAGLKEVCASFGKAAQSSCKLLLSLDISNQLDVTFIKFFRTLFLQLYMFRAFLVHLQELVCCIGSCWLDK
jgi:hypothetical protein